LRGRYYLAQAPATLEPAIQHFEKALAIDSVFAPARAGLSESFWWFAQTGRPEFFARSRVEARRAIDLDPSLPEAHVAEGLARMSDWDWTGSEAAFKRAIELNPSASQARQWYAQLLRVMLRLDEALVQARRAVELDPFSLIVRAMEGWVHFSNGRQDEALKVYERVLELEPGFGIAIYNQGLSYQMLRQGDSVIRAAERAASARLPLDSLHSDMLLTIGYALAGRREDARATLDRLEARLVPTLPNSFRAIVYHELGDDRKALDLLERSLALREPDLPLVTSEPGFDRLRQNIRFRNVRRAMRLP
jgi:tetratricopeptide (TPR) repeat protein